MGYVARLKRGGRMLDLASGRYAVGEDFTPPTVNEDVYTAPGSSANAIGGAQRIGRRASNRTWMFSLTLRGSTIAEIKRAAQDVSAFLAWAGDEDEPTYFEFNESDAVPTPSWGQDGTLRYEIVQGRLDFASDNLYSNAIVTPQGIPFCTVTLTIKPYALGLPQTAAQARGHIAHDTVGAANGRDRGVSVPFSSTNHFSNPIFGNPVWNLGWTADPGLTARENTDPEYVAFGVRSAKLQAHGASRIFYRLLTLTAATYTLSLYAKRPGGGAVTSSHVAVYFNNALQTSTYTSVGNGWYRVAYTGTASASGAGYGVVVSSNVTVYVDGFQVENVGYATPLAHGDMYGCAWSGTAHDSTTTRSTAGYMRVGLSADNWNVGSGSVRAVVAFTTSAFGSNAVIFYESATGMRLFWNNGSGVWTLSDNTNSVTGGTLAANTTYVFHAVWEPGRLQLYINGASVATGGTFTASTSTPTSLYIGSDPTPILQQNHIFRDVTIYDVALTTAQVAADYARIAPQVAAGERVTSIPYLWTKDGDAQVDSWNDSTNDNYGVYHGVPGTAPAKVDYTIAGEIGSYGVNYLGLWQTSEYCDPGRLLYYEQSGTAHGYSSGGQFLRTAITTTETAVSTHTAPWSSDPAMYRFVEGREWFAAVRAKTSAGSVMGRQVLTLGNVPAFMSASGSYAPVANYFAGYFAGSLLGSIVFPRLRHETILLSAVTHRVQAYGSTSANLDVDFVALLPRPLAVVGNGRVTRITGTRWVCDFDGNAFVSAPGTIMAGSTGDELALLPDTFNVMLLFGQGNLVPATEVEDANNVKLTFTTTTITPRYHLT